LIFHGREINKLRAPHEQIEVAIELSA